MLMLARDYKGTDPTGWFMSEKLDGVRARWDGNKIASREGNEFKAPVWWLAMMPIGVVLDGELWIGRGEFQATLSIVRKQTPVNSEWERIKFRAFDVPVEGVPFRQRRLMIPVDLAVKSFRVEDPSHFDSFYDAVLSQGGEGAMLNDPNAMYADGRSDAVLRRKPTVTDECTVTGHVPGKGKFEGMCGALACVWNGVHFALGAGLTNEQRENPPEVGARVTFERKGVTDAGKPRHPVFIAVRDYE